MCLGLKVSTFGKREELCEEAGVVNKVVVAENILSIWMWIEKIMKEGRKWEKMKKAEEAAKQSLREGERNGKTSEKVRAW